MAELHTTIERINELRVKEMSGKTLSDTELSEVFTLLAEVRQMRAGKSPEKAAAAAKAASLPDAEDYF